MEIIMPGISRGFATGYYGYNSPVIEKHPYKIGDKSLLFADVEKKAVKRVENFDFGFNLCRVLQKRR